MNIRAARRLLLCLFLLCAATPLLGQNVTFTSVQSGPWDDPNTWDVGGGQFPSDGSFHHVVIASGHTVTIANSALAADLTFTGGGTSRSVVVSTGQFLTVNGAVTFNDPSGIGVTNTLDVGAGDATVGSVVLTGGSVANSISLLSIGSGTLTVNGGVTVSGLVSNAKITFSGAGTLDLSGSLGNGATLTNFTGAPGSLIRYSGTGAQTVGAYAYQRLILNKTSGTASAGGTLSVAGTFTQSGGVFDLLVASADFFSADVNGTINGTAGIQFTGSLASLSGTGTINAPVTIATSKNISNGSSLNFGTISLLSGVTMTNAGTADVTNITGADATSTWVNNGTLKISGNLLNPTGTLTATLITNTVEYDGTSQAVKPTTYATLALKGSGAVSVSGIPSVLAGFNVGGTTAATLAGALSVAGTVNIGSTASLDLGSFVHSVGGNWTNNGTLVAGTSTVIFNGGSAQNIVNNTSAFASVQFSGVGLKSSNSGLDVDKDFTIASGSNFDGSSFTHKVGGNWTNLGTFAYGTSTVEFDGAVGTQTISGTAPVSFASLTVTNPSGLSLSQHVQVNNVLNIGPNVIATNAFAVLMSGGSSLTRTSGWIWGELKRKNATGSTTFEVGTPSGYSPVTMFITGTADTAVQSVSGSGCCTFDGANHLGQSWQIFAASPVTADLTFTWPAGVPGTEANYVLGRYQAAAWTYPISTVTPATHTGTTSGQTINSTAASWTAGEPSSLGGAPPTVSSFNPTAGSQGVTVILTGTSFTGATAVAFNGTPATFVVDSDTQITTGVPAGATSGTISVTNADGTGMSAGSFTVNAPGVIQSAASGAWTTPATWVGNIPPGTLDQVQIHNTHTVTLTASATCGALTVSSGGTADIGTSTLTVNGAATINGAVTGSGSLTLATTATLDGTGTFAPPVTIQATRTVQSSANLAFNGGMIVQGGATLTNDGQVHVDNANGILGSGAFINGNNATLTVGGPLVPTLTATAPGNSVDYDGGAQTVQATAYHYLFLSGSGTKTMTGVSSIGADLSISGSAVAVAGSGMTISGSVNVNSGSATLTLGSFTHNVAGNWTNNGTVNAAGSVVNFNGSSAQSINGTFANLKINKPSGTATLASSILVTDTTTLTSGVLDIGSNNLTTTDLTGPGALSMGSSGSLSISGDSNTFTGIFIPGTSAVIIDGNGSQLLRGGTYYDLYIQKPTGTATLTAVTTATHKLWVSSGTLADGGNQISSFGSSTLQVDAFATLILGSGAASTSFPGGFTTNTLAPASDVTYAAANSAQQIASFPNYGWLTVDSGGGAGIVKTVDGGAIINAVRLDPTNGAGSLTLDLAGKTANVSGTLGGDGAITFGASTGALNIGGDFANTGAFTRGLSTVTFNGTGNQQVRGVSYHNLTINKVSGFAQLAGATTVFGNLGVTNGTLQGLTNTLIVEGSFSNNGSIDAGSNNWRFRGAVANNGTFTGSTGALVLDGSAPQTWSGSSVASLNNLQMANLSGVTLNKTVSVNGSLDLAGGIITVAGGEQLSMSTAVVTRSAGYVNGALTMNLPNATTRTFHVGTASGYAPVDVLPNGAGLMTVTPKQGPHPNVNTPSVLQRYWTIATTIPTAGVLQFIWNAGEAAGTEASYVTGRYNGGTWAQPGGTVNPTLHFAQISNPSLTGDWTVGEPSAFAGVADLSVGVTSVPPSVLFNQVYNYSVAVNNAGPDPATGVSVNMTLTGDATITGASAPGWACGNTATTATCTLASLATGAPQTITVNTTANASGTGASLAATVTATSIDTNAANDNASAFTSIGPLQADLTLTHVVSGPTSVPPSTLVTFNLSVTNDGSATATNINLTDVLPSGLSYVSNTASGLTCNPVGSNVVCTAPTLLVGNTATAAITVNAVTGGTLTATASVSATEADPNTADNSASAAVTVINVSTLTVESNADSGNFTLRQAILDANSGACVVPCSILFNLPAGQHVIAPTSPFPALTARMFLQAHTQPGYVSAPIVELDGTNAGGIGLQLTANGSQVRGFVIRNFPNAGILVSGGGAVIRDNYLGTDISGTVAAPNTDGVRLTSGTTLIEHNLISGNSGSGIRITGSGSDGNIIQGNFIGTDAGGTINLGNGKGIELGVNPLSTVIGGTGAGERNTIAFNGTGVAVLGSPGNSILANSFYGNTTLGIDLDGDAVANPNDLGDGDGGGNNQQNHPQLVSASIVGANVNVTLQLESSAVPTTQSLLVEVFKAQGSEGKTFLGRQCYGTNDPGTVGLTIPSALVTSGDPIVATATSYQDLACSGTVNDGTSEFSNVVNAVCTPPAATITHAAQVCANSTGNFAAAPAGAASYVWGVTNGTLTGGQGTPNITYDAGPSGSVGLTLTISNGACSSNGSSSVPIAAAITPPTITGPTASCSNSTIALSASAGYATYSWSDGVQVVGTTQNITAQPQVDTTYTLTVSNGAGCTAAATHGVTVTPTGPVVITAPANVNPSSSGNAASVAVRPAGTAYTWSASGGTITGGQGTNAVTFNAGTGSSMTLSITVVQNGCTSTGTKTIAIGQSADLSISKSSDVATVGAGANVTFIIGVTNAGPNASGGLTVTEALPPGTTLVSAAGSGWTFTTLNALTVSASHASINAGAGAEPITVVLTAPNAAGPITNVASVSGGVRDPNIGNNTASATVNVGGGNPNCPTAPPQLMTPAANAVD
ncbi:MAG TPA: hypothetical protein VJ276_22635, partial [Thermoanaerobaculia bacterium]|nr:hypothetical protein [Thermoanaerobaculia bacterium]